MTAAAPDTHTPAGAVRALRSTTAVRARAQQLLARARAGASHAFAVDDAALSGAARTVAELTRQRFPDGRIPYHSRWRHFEAGGVDRKARLDTWLGPADAAARARAQVQFDGLVAKYPDRSFQHPSVEQLFRPAFPIC